MKHINEIIKKVELFEKLALYGDRTSFLEALAKNDSTTNNKNANIATNKK